MLRVGSSGHLSHAFPSDGTVRMGYVYQPAGMGRRADVSTIMRARYCIGFPRGASKSRARYCCDALSTMTVSSVVLIASPRTRRTFCQVAPRSVERSICIRGFIANGVHPAMPARPGVSPNVSNVNTWPVVVPAIDQRKRAFTASAGAVSVTYRNDVTSVDRATGVPVDVPRRLSDAS